MKIIISIIRIILSTFSIVLLSSCYQAINSDKNIPRNIQFLNTMNLDLDSNNIFSMKIPVQNLGTQQSPIGSVIITMEYSTDSNGGNLDCTGLPNAPNAPCVKPLYCTKALTIPVPALDAGEIWHSTPIMIVKGIGGCTCHKNHCSGKVSLLLSLKTNPPINAGSLPNTSVIYGWSKDGSVVPVGFWTKDRNL